MYAMITVVVTAMADQWSEGAAAVVDCGLMLEGVEVLLEPLGGPVDTVVDDCVVFDCDKTVFSCAASTTSSRINRGFKTACIVDADV